MALGETGDWQGAVNRITQMIHNTAEIDPLEGALPEGYGSGRLLEALARELEAEHGMELGMALPTLLAAFSAAGQGGFTVPMIRKINPHPSYLWVPTVIQFMGIAEAGQQKSTLLGEIAPLVKKALDRDGADDRRALVNQWRMEEMKKAEQLGLKVDANAPDWIKVFEGGLCQSSYASTGTPEGFRDWQVENGGHRVILTAEPDILREVSAYAGRGGSGTLNNFLGGWDQEDVATDRAGKKDLFIREPSMPFVIMLQPGSFRKHTEGRDGTDDFVDRGVFSRMLIWKAQRTPAADGDGFGLGDWELPENWDPDAAMGSALLALQSKLADRMVSVVLRSNPYRVSKGVERAYSLAKLGWDMPRPTLLERNRIRLHLDGTQGHKVAWKVQRMRAMLLSAVRQADAVQHGVGDILDPFTQRFTSHVMRLAGNLTLADDPGATVVDTGHIEDCATRLMPWLWAGWWAVMRERMELTGQAAVSEGLLKNSKDKDLTAGPLLLKVLADLEKNNGPAAVAGFTPSKVLKKAEDKFSSHLRTTALRGQLRTELLGLAGEGLIEKVGSAVSATGEESGRYRITELGRLMIKNYAE
jgi:hypothetical protein